MKKRNKITAEERDKIAVFLATGDSLRSISRKLERSVSSISDEVKRNSYKDRYSSIKAQALSEKRNKESRKNNPLKSPEIYSYVRDKLRCGWSPEQISGRLKRDNKNQTIICHETIYRYIYSKDGKDKNLSEYLARNHKKRWKWKGRKGYQRGIQNKVSIHDRPDVINNLKQFGHWEIDSVEGKAHKGGIHTFLERKTRYYLAEIMNNLDSEEGLRTQLKVFSPLPKKARRSATFDNGKENYNHTKLRFNLGMKTYFCDPNAPWQKGSNENHNGILRRYIPKKTDLTRVHQEVLDLIVDEINNRPRKCLKYQTPSEAFTEELNCIK